MPPVGLEPTISAGERPKTYALDRAATGTGVIIVIINIIILEFCSVKYETPDFSEQRIVAEKRFCS
jgi:hypothetical protein